MSRSSLMAGTSLAAIDAPMEDDAPYELSWSQGIVRYTRRLTRREVEGEGIPWMPGAYNVRLTGPNEFWNMPRRTGADREFARPRGLLPTTPNRGT